MCLREPIDSAYDILLKKLLLESLFFANKRQRNNRIYTKKNPYNKQVLFFKNKLYLKPFSLAYP